jgi:hypothetical protein
MDLECDIVDHLPLAIALGEILSPEKRVGSGFDARQN